MVLNQLTPFSSDGPDIVWVLILHLYLIFILFPYNIFKYITRKIYMIEMYINLYYDYDEYTLLF